MLGIWWLPDLSYEGPEFQDPEHSVPGILNNDTSRMRELTTIGSLRSSSRNEIFRSLGQSLEHSVIWGTDSQGNSLSLFDSMRASMSFQSSSPRGGTESWFVSWYTSGSAWVTQQSTIDRIVLQFDLLPEWTSGRSFPDFDFELGADALNLPKREKHTAAIDNAIINLHFGHNARSSTEGYHATRFSAFEIEDSIRLDQVVDKWVKPLKILLDLLTGISARIVDISVRTADVQRPLDLYSNLLHQTRDKPDKSRRQLDIYASRVSLDHNGVDFSALLTHYLALYESKHRIALQSLSESQSELVDQSTASELLSVCQAIEQYHKVAIGGSHIPSEEFNSLLDAAVQAIAPQRREWFHRKVGNCNVKPLSTRIEEIIHRAGNTGVSIERALPGFRRKVVESRNRVAHGSSSRDGERVLLYHSLALGLRWLLRHVYLLELGVPSDGTDQIIQNDGQFKRDIHLLEATESA